MAQNEYLVTPYLGDKATGDTAYFYSRKEALENAKYLLTLPDVDNVDLQVIYDHESHDSELADVYWTVTKQGITKTA